MADVPPQPAPSAEKPRLSIGQRLLSAKPDYTQLKEVLNSERVLFLLGQFLAGIVVIMSMTINRDSDQTDNYGYGIAAGAVGAFFSLVGLFFCKAAIGEKILFTAPLLGELNFSAVLILALAIWWALAMYILTFKGPFLVTGNGYFATWAGFGASIACVGVTVPRLKVASESFTMVIGLGVASFVVGLELCVGVSEIALAAAPQQVILGMIGSVFVFLCTLVLLVLQLEEKPVEGPLRKAIFIAVVVVWGIICLWLTFDAPFTTTGNGYFGLWAGLICASKVALDESGAYESTRAKAVAAIQNEKLAAMWGQFVAAAVVLIKLTFISSEYELWGYAVSVGIIGLVFSAGGAFLLSNPYGNKMLSGKAWLTPNVLLAVFLFVWWSVATGVLTVERTSGATLNVITEFSVTGNGYFAVWAGLICSVIAMGVSVAPMKAAHSAGLSKLIGFIVAAVVLIIELSPNISDSIGPKGAEIYGLIVSCFTVAYMLFVLLLRWKKQELGVLEKPLCLLFFVLWTTLACWLTFEGPFTTTGNGYFACWGGLLSSVCVCWAIFYPPAPPKAGTDEEQAVPTLEQTYATEDKTEVLEDRQPAGGESSI